MLANLFYMMYTVVSCMLHTCFSLKPGMILTTSFSSVHLASLLAFQFTFIHIVFMPVTYSTDGFRHWNCSDMCKLSNVAGMKSIWLSPDHCHCLFLLRITPYTENRQDARLQRGSCCICSCGCSNSLTRVAKWKARCPWCTHAAQIALPHRQLPVLSSLMSFRCRDTVHFFTEVQTSVTS